MAGTRCHEASHGAARLVWDRPLPFSSQGPASMREGGSSEEAVGVVDSRRMSTSFSWLTSPAAFQEKGGCAWWSLARLVCSKYFSAFQNPPYHVETRAV